MEVVVFGAGSLGSLVGGFLSRAHDVTLVGRDPHVRRVRRSGLTVTGVDSFECSPAAVTDAAGLTADLAVVTVKSYDTEAATETLATGRYDAVLSLQNGMGNEETLAASLTGVLAGTTTHGAILTEPGVVEWTGRGETTIGPWSPGTAALADRVGEAFRAASCPVTVDADVQGRLWEKLAVNAAINPPTALMRVKNGALFSGPAAPLSVAAARETARVACAVGVPVGESAAVERAREVGEATAANRSSMYQDVLAGRPTEIDAIAGYVAEAGTDHGVAVPVNRTLWRLVRGWEGAADLR